MPNQEVVEIAMRLEEMVSEFMRQGCSRALAIKTVLSIFQELLSKTTASNSTFMIGVPDDSR